MLQTASFVCFLLFWAFLVQGGLNVRSPRRDSIYSQEGLSKIADIFSSHATSSGPPSPAPGGNITLIADGFVWAENLIFDDFDNLWVTDNMQGILFKITKDSSNGAISKMPWLTGFNSLGLLGLATGPNTTIFFVGHTKATGKTLNSFDVHIPNVWKVISTTATVGNGLVYVSETDTLFSASEAGFTPNEGRVYFVNNATRGVPPTNAPTLQSGLNDCDGLFRDEKTNFLYMSEVITATLYVYNLSANPMETTHRPIRTFHAPNMTMLDDMCIVQAIQGTSVTSPSIIAADFWTGNIVAFGVDGMTPGSYVATGMTNPTSVRRPKQGSVWDNGRNVFVTEGGNFFEKIRRVWEVTLPAM